MKTCSQCRTELDERFFWTSRGKLRAYCKACDTARRRRVIERDPDYFARKTAKNMCKKREWLKARKDAPCADCGQRYPFYVMEFDHREREAKKFTIGAGRSISFADLKVEVEKCDVVCANCHRIRTFEQKAWMSAKLNAAM